MVEGAQIESAIRSELKHFRHVAFAFLFGSAAANRLRTDSDIDVAIYVDAVLLFSFGSVGASGRSS